MLAKFQRLIAHSIGKAERGRTISYTPDKTNLAQTLQTAIWQYS